MSIQYYRKVLRIGHSCAVTLPREITQHLGLLRGDTLYVSLSAKTITLTKVEPPKGSGIRL